MDRHLDGRVIPVVPWGEQARHSFAGTGGTENDGQHRGGRTEYHRLSAGVAVRARELADGVGRPPPEGVDELT